MTGGMFLAIFALLIFVASMAMILIPIMKHSKDK